MGVSDDFRWAMGVEAGDERAENGTLMVVLCSIFNFFCLTFRFSCLVSLIFKHANFSKVNAKFSKGVDF